MKTRVKIFLFHTRLFSALILLAYAPLNVAAQNRQVTAIFQQKEFELHNGEVISNVLQVVNTGDAVTRFTLNVDYPAGWKLLYNTKTTYEFSPSDTIYIPIRIVPLGSSKGNSRFMVSAFAVSDDDIDLGHDLFWAYTKKQTNWSLSVEPGNTIYFRNNENEARFNVSVLNTGTEKQPIVFSVNNMSLFSAVNDSAGNPVKKTSSTLMLNSYEDTTFQLSFKYLQGKRNFNRIDVENYRPENHNEERSFNVLITTEEPNFGQPGAFSASQRISFKKLSDDKQASQQSFSHMPLVVDYNISNLLDNVTFSTLNLRGQAQLGAEKSIVYNFQGNAIGSNYDEFIKNSNYYVGYFHSKGNVQAGFINGGYTGLQSFGRGIKGAYNLNKRNTVNAFYVFNTDRFGKTFLTSYGTGYTLRYFKQNTAHIEYGHSANTYTGTKSHVLNSRVGYNFYKTHTLNINFSNSWNQIDNSYQGKQNTHGYFLMVNYGGTFLKNKLGINHGLGHNTKEYANSNVSRLFYNHRARYLFNDKWSVMLVNNFNRSSSTFYNNADNTSITNQFAVNRSFKMRSVQPMIFYNIFNLPTFTYHMKGAGINYNVFNTKDNTRFSTTLEAGYNTPINVEKAKESSFLQWNSIMFYKTLSANARYIIGNYGISGRPDTGQVIVTQQIFSGNLQHQHLFRNTKFMLQSGINYFYNNVFKQHNLSLNPEIYYFTSEGWRFRLGMNYGYTSSIALKNIYNPNSNGEEPQRVSNENVFITVGVRKEFAIPVPFKQQKFCDVEIAAFYDINGNGVKDKNERPVENVVIKLGDEEVITNADGECRIRGTKMGKNTFKAVPLDPVESWFPNIEDSALILKNKTLFIPFVKGVKIKGKVSIDREAIAADASEPFDLSLIKITAVGGKTYNALTGFDGSFEFYLPYGKYIITMDEGVLGTKFKLARNNFEVDVTREADGMYLSYLIIEKKRKVNRKIFTQPDTNQK